MFVASYKIINKSYKGKVGAHGKEAFSKQLTVVELPLKSHQHVGQ
jgi:hypothetical protein